MESVTIIAGKEIYDRCQEIMNLSPEIQRIRFYRMDFNTGTYTNKKETDTHIYWSTSIKKPMFENNKLFFKRQTLQGMTYDKSTKKIKIWFGNHISGLNHDIYNDVAKNFAPWLMNLPHSIRTLLNNTIFSKIISQKVNSPQELVNEYLKTSSYKKMNVDKELFYKTFNNNLYNHSPKIFKNYFLCANDINEALMYISNKYKDIYYIDGPYEHLCYYAVQLDKKVDFHMSETEVETLILEYKELVQQKIKIYETLES